MCWRALAVDPAEMHVLESGHEETLRKIFRWMIAMERLHRTARTVPGWRAHEMCRNLVLELVSSEVGDAAGVAAGHGGDPDGERGDSK